MAQTLTNLLIHVIFSTKERRQLIGPGLKSRLHAYLGGIVRKIGGRALAINGTADHVHLLISLPATMAVAEAVRLIKANSSKWVHEIEGRRLFSWQAGYSAFSVSQSVVPAVRSYIRDQERHHQKATFQQELVRLLKTHGVQHDDSYMWD